MLSYRPVGHQNNPTEWRLYIDASKLGLKAVLLHSGNKFPSAPLVHSAKMRVL